MAVLPNKTLDSYELLDRIAVGGMAEVFRAVAYGAHGFEKTLAIKRILPELARDPEFKARFIAEAKLAVQLTHANIVQVFDFGRVDGTMFIAMEFVDGLDLSALLKSMRERGQQIPVAAAFQIAIEITRGLDFAHQHKVVHRDVSPSNILLSRAGEVKIADFGIAQAASEHVGQVKSRRRIMGKWRYMSPEQTTGSALDTRSDVFSAAAVLFELFTGEKLFVGEEADAIIENIHTMELPKASERRPGLPPRLDDVLARCLDRDPEKRPSKPGEVVRALTELSYESSIVATAFDVAEAVRGALGTSAAETAVAADSVASAAAPAGLDALIRKQLGGGGVPEVKTGTRRTAVDGAADDSKPDMSGRTHTATAVRKGVDDDGVTLWELAGDTAEAGPEGPEDSEPPSEDTIAAVPSALRLGKSTGSVAAITENSTDLGKERSESGDAAEAGRGARKPWSSIRISVTIVAAMLLVATGVTVWALSHSDSTTVAGGAAGDASAAVVVDAATAGQSDAGASAEARGTLDVNSTPPGARVWVDDVELPDVTPTTVLVDATIAHKVEIEAVGFARFTLQGVRVAAGARLPLRPMLAAMRATLSVQSVPLGADVELDGKRIGRTPLTRTDLNPGLARAVVVRKRGFVSARASVDLVAGRPATLERTLERAVVYGKIRIGMRGWADVYLRGRKLGTVPRQALKLPVGKYRLTLENPPTKRKKQLDVEVISGETRIYRFSW